MMLIIWPAVLLMTRWVGLLSRLRVLERSVNEMAGAVRTRPRKDLRVRRERVA